MENPLSDDNSADRLHDVFFYGLYMDPELIKERGAVPRTPRKGKVPGYALKIGKLATLIRKSDASTPGIIYALTHGEIEHLYRGSGLVHHQPEALSAEMETGKSLTVLCFNLVNPPHDDESNPEYAGKLALVKARLGLE